jgi:uncharacterized protein HemX
VVQWGLAALAVGLFAMSGCSDPRYAAAHARRLASIEEVLAIAEARERQCEPNLAGTFAIIEQETERHERSLAKTARTIEDAQQREIEQWPARWEEAETEIRKQLAGNPENIDETVLLMFY